MQTSFTIATFRGVPIKVDISLIVLAVWLVIEAGGGNPRIPFAESLVVGLVTAVLLVTSVALHELGHTAVALNYGCRVRDITLMLIGGRATMLDIPRSPAKEFWMAIAGPGVSAALWLLGIHLERLIEIRARLAGGMTTSGFIAATLFFWMAMINKSLFLFNLIPAFPMDGGRILRSILARRFNRVFATYIASRIGRAIAVAMGIYGIFRGQWTLAIIAYFIFNSADAEYRMACYEDSGFFGRGWSGGDSRGGRGGWGGWGRFFGRRDRDDDDDDIHVSPPPYGR